MSCAVTEKLRDQASIAPVVSGGEDSGVNPFRTIPWDWKNWLRAWARGAADFIYPPACRLCTADLPETDLTAEPGAPFCASCRSQLLAWRGTSCIRCAAPLGPYLDPQKPCIFCRNDTFAFERVFRLGVYDTILATACLRAKSAHGESLAAGLADLLWECEGNNLEQVGIDVALAVPPHWLKRWTAAHHAAETLASVWARKLKVPLAPHILTKRRWTRPQSRLPPAERRQNLRDAFRVEAAADLRGATVLLADDVLTTGTTAHEVSKLLLQAGAGRVVVAVIARGLGRR
ncbi:MAG: ComF family protein [Planctomycetes bacterium]|nr:ComF family protein [Planctomycetota bacterium]